MASTRIQVFEHQSIKVGEVVDDIIFTSAHFDALSLFSEQRPNKFYKLTHNGIRFSHYVGVLQIKGLTIEILPKISQHDNTDKAVWQRALLEMLRQCRLLKVDSLSSAYLRLQSNAILELYIGIFIEEVEQLLRRGLIKQYVRKQAKLNHLKGRLLLAQQMRKQLAHQEFFFTEYGQYTYDHVLNRMINAALSILSSFPLAPPLLARLHRIIQVFPKVSSLSLQLGQYPTYRFNRMTEHYRTGVEIAHLLIGNYHPSLQAGSSNVLAILFDMNHLFEEYVYQQLIKVQHTDIKVTRKVNRPFWGRSFLKPDIVIEYKNHRFVLDTKWKVLKGTSPSMQDLRQIYTYSKQFSAKHGILVYPESKNSSETARQAFVTPPEDAFSVDCQVVMLEILKDGQLNKKLGTELLDKIWVGV